MCLQSGYDIFPIKFGRLPLFIPDDQHYLRSLAWDTREDGVGILKRGEPDLEDGVEKERSKFADLLEIYFEARKGKFINQSYVL